LDPTMDPNEMRSDLIGQTNRYKQERERLGNPTEPYWTIRDALGPSSFKTGALNHSATLPSLDVSDLAGARGRGKRQIGRDWCVGCESAVAMVSRF
jgi:hypothetical protein